MHQDDLFDLIDGLSRSAKVAEGQEMLRQVLSRHGLDHVAYAALNLPSVARSRPIVSVTYAPEWQKHYAQHGLVDLDPVVRAGLGGILPVDWTMIDREDPAVLRFFGEAQEFKVGSQGLSIPIRGRHGEFALFTVTSSVRAQEWESLKGELMRDLMLLAYNFHAAALRAEGIEHMEHGGRLSRLQASCLRWSGHGKTEKEVAAVVGITPRMVKFHLETARAALEAGNTTQAVAKALSLGLINLAYEPSGAMQPTRERPAQTAR